MADERPAALGAGRSGYSEALNAATGTRGNVAAGMIRRSASDGAADNVASDTARTSTTCDGTAAGAASVEGFFMGLRYAEHVAIFGKRLTSDSALS